MVAKIILYLELVLSALAVGSAHAESKTIDQVLSRRGSQITFGVESPNPGLRMNGSISEFSGVFSLDPNDLTRSHLELTVSLSSMKLPPEQALQAILLQGIVARVSPTPRTFQSSHFEHVSGPKYLVHGSYDWLSRREKVVVPITIDSASPQASSISVIFSGDFKKRAVPAQLQGLANDAVGSKGWTKAKLIFTPRSSRG
jgi:polyisoprenoid-binding protein YceI